MKALAGCEQVCCKLSCLCLQDGDGLRVSYDDMFRDFKRMTGELSTSDRQKLFHGNAARFYRL